MAELRYMLDTDTCIFIARERPEQVLRRLGQLPSGCVCISAITFAELMCGAMKSQRRNHNVTRLQRFAEQVPVLPFSHDACIHYGDIRSRLERRGETIGGYDLLIGAHARSAALTLVSNNAREFRRIPKLAMENWAS